MKEQWKSVCEYEGLYSVSNLGRVRNARTNMVLKGNPDKNGYLLVGLHNSLGQRTYKVHALVLTAFRRTRPAAHQGCHRNDVPGDNRLSNLYWGTGKKNAEDRARRGGYPSGENHPTAKFNCTDSERVLDLVEAGIPHRRVGAWLGISKTQVGRIVKRLV